MKIALPNRRRLYLLLPFLFFIGLPGLFAQTSGLDQKINLKLKKQNLVQALQMIEEQSEVRFTYNNNDLPTTLLRRRFRRKSLKFILDELLGAAGLIYKESGQYLVIIPAPKTKSSAPKPRPPANYTISGYVRDSLTGEALIGGTIFIEEKGQGVATNAYGFYSISLPAGQYHLQYSYLGFENLRLEIELNSNQKIDAGLNLWEQELPDVIVHSITGDEHLSELKMSSVNLAPKDLRSIATLLSEPDVLRTIQLLPGVVAVGNGGFSVRGGKADQNLIILDEAPVYNTTHLLGVMSVFNVDAIKNIELIKGGMPSEYRGRLSSVLDVRMKEGTTSRKLSGKGGIGLLASRLTLEGRLFNKKGSFMLAARRSYLDFIVELFASDALNTNFFSDYNFKGNYRLGDNDRLFFSAYLGKDEYGVDQVPAIEWGNKTATLRWNHLFNDKLFMNTSAVFSSYKFRAGSEISVDTTGDVEISDLSVETTIRDINLNTRFQYYLAPEHQLKFGFNIIHHQFIPAAVFNKERQLVDGVIKNGVELGAYISEERPLNDQLKVEYGVHISDFIALGGGGQLFEYDDAGQKVDSIFYKKGQLVRNYFGIEPRFLSTYTIDDRQSVKFSYTRTYQYLQSLNGAFSNNPATVWLPSSRNIRPQNADQLSLGYFRNFANNQIEFSLELYYKQMNRQIEYRDGALLGLAPREIEALLVYGKTKAQGVEVSLRKKSGRFWGWMSYTYSRSKNYFQDINDGLPYVSDVDIPHNFAIVGVWNINKKCTMAANWVYRSGRVATVPAGKFQILGRPVDFYTTRNNYRFPPYHRLDISLTIKRKGRKQRASNWNFALHNVYFRKNPLYIFYDPRNQNDNGAISQISIVQLLPSVSYNFEF